MLIGMGQEDRLARMAEARRVRQRGDIAKSTSRQHGVPPCGIEKRVVWTKVVIAEAPPSLRYAEDDVQPARTARDLEQHEQAARRKQRSRAGQSLAEVWGRVQHVGCEDDIGALRREALSCRIASDIEDGGAEAGYDTELLLRLCHEKRRDVCKYVGDASGWQMREQGRRASSGAAADLDEADRRRPGSSGDRIRDSVDHDSVVERGGWGLAVAALQRS